MKKRILTMILAIVLMLSTFGMSAYADTDEHADRQPDYSRTGSVTVHLQTDAKTPVSGGTLTAYMVAQAREKDGNQEFIYHTPFGAADEIVDADVIDEAEEGAHQLASELAQYISGAQGTTVQVDDSGNAFFGDLKLGLYLIVQEKPADGYEPVEPFLVTVPIWDGSKLDYKVDASPKVSAVYEKAKLHPAVEKVVDSKNGTPSAEDIYVFRMTPKEMTAPMPQSPQGTADSTSGVLTVQKKGPGAVDFGTISYGLDDVEKTYTYTVEEIPGSDSRYTYDKISYLMTVKVYMENGKIQINVGCSSSDNKAVDKMIFTNIYDDSVPVNHTSVTNTLPQTGILFWPIVIFAAAGMFLFCMGAKMRRS